MINELTATEFRKGYGKGIMKDLIEQAEEQGKKLTLFPQQLEGITGGMDDEALVSFYKSLGFKTRFAINDDTLHSLLDFNKYLIYELQDGESDTDDVGGGIQCRYRCCPERQSVAAKADSRE